MGLSAVRVFCHSQPDIHFPELTTQHEHPPTIREQCPQEHEFIAIAAHAHANALLLPLLSLTHEPSPYCLSLPPRSPRTAPLQPPRTSCWRGLFIDHVILSQTVQFLQHKDLLVLSQCSQSLKTFTTLHLLQNTDNWSLTICMLQPYIQGPSRLREEKEHIESQYYQHSEDVDRTSGYFDSQSQVDLVESKLKLDRVVTAVSFQVRYFQGIMPICATLLQSFNQPTCYWLLRYLLLKSRYIQLDIQLYARFIQELEEEFIKVLPKLHQHLEDNGFELNYFVMKWVMGLFSEDMPKPMLLAVWDVLCHTGLDFLPSLIISVFSHLEGELLESQADQINQLLKWNLRQRLETVQPRSLLNHSKQLYLEWHLFRMKGESE